MKALIRPPQLDSHVHPPDSDEEQQQRGEAGGGDEHVGIPGGGEDVRADGGCDDVHQRAQRHVHGDDGAGVLGRGL